ncbi:MAG: hypothetical protein HY665_05975 [Chloroflexi bacterium]|nr:hypothetical protein [Chloroflexota bacterium]
MTTRNPFDTPAKRAVREQWNTPLLSFLNQRYGYRFRYMGLPGVELLDVKLWRGMIDEVIAFETVADPTKEDLEGRRNIVALRRNLRVLGIPGRAFFGPMEEVVTLRQDYDGARYEPDKVITLYNLDFCDEISSRIATRERGVQLWRFEAIRQILRDQRESFQHFGGPRFFIMLLTVRDQINADRLRGFLSRNLYGDAETFLQACGGIGSLPPNGALVGTHPWALKCFIHNTLRQFLANPNISTVFFPLLRYQGTRVRTGEGFLESPMLHWMLLCRFDEPHTPTPSFLPTNYLANVSSVAVTTAGALQWQTQRGETAATGVVPISSQWLNNAAPNFLGAP